MFCVTTALTSPRRSSSASARCASFGSAPGQHVDPRRVEAPDLLRVVAERAERRVLHRVDLGPDPGRRAEVRDAALGRDAGAGEDDARLAARDQLGKGRTAVRRAPLASAAYPLRCYVRWRSSSRNEVTVRFAETDAQGIAHHAAYLVWFEVDADRVPAPLPGRLPGLREEGVDALTLEAYARYTRRGALRRPAHDPGALQRRPRRPLPVRLLGRARRRPGRRRLDDARLRLRRRPPADAGAGLARRGDRRGREL